MLTKKYFLLIPSVLGCRAEEREGILIAMVFTGVVTTLNHSNCRTGTPWLRNGQWYMPNLGPK